MAPSLGAPDVSVLVVSYRTRDLTRACLTSVVHASAAGDVEVVVVDNASDDGSAEMVAAEFPDLRLIALDENVGFARAVNLGAAHARGRVLVLVNPDDVLHDGALRALVRFLDTTPLAGVVGGRTLGPSGEVDTRSC